MFDTQPEDAVRRVVRQDRLQGKIPRRLDDSSHDAARRLDFHQRSHRQQLVAADRTDRPLRQQRHVHRQRCLLRPLRRRRERGDRASEPVLPGQLRRRSLQGGDRGADQHHQRELDAPADAAATPPTSPTLQALVDLPNTVLEWAAEAVVNDADGYYGGSHNYLHLRQGAAGLRLDCRPHRFGARVAGAVRAVGVVQGAPHLLVGRPRRARPPGADYLHRHERRRLARHSTSTPSRRRWPSGIPPRSPAGPTPGRRRSPTPIAADPHKWATIDQVKTAMSALQDFIVRTDHSTCRASSAANRATAADSADQDQRWRPLVQRLRRRESGCAIRGRRRSAETTSTTTATASSTRIARARRRGIRGNPTRAPRRRAGRTDARNTRDNCNAGDGGTKGRRSRRTEIDDRANISTLITGGTGGAPAVVLVVGDLAAERGAVLCLWGAGDHRRRGRRRLRLRNRGRPRDRPRWRRVVTCPGGWRAGGMRRERWPCWAAWPPEPSGAAADHRPGTT